MRKTLSIIALALCILTSNLFYVENVQAGTPDGKTRYRALLWGGNGYYEQNSIQLKKTLRSWPNWKKAEIKDVATSEEALFKDYIEGWLAKADDDDITLIYMDAHGGPTKDVNKDDPGTPQNDEELEPWGGGSLRDDELGPELEKIQGNIIVIIDACNSGGFAGKNEGTGTEAKQDLAKIKNSKHIVVLQSCKSTEPSGVDEEKGMGDFTEKLLEGMQYATKKADKSGDGSISAEEAMEYVGKEIIDKGTGEKQHPQMCDGNDKEEKIFLVMPEIKSANEKGAEENYFYKWEPIYVSGSGFAPDTTYPIYVVGDDWIDWGDGMKIPNRVPGTAERVTTDDTGALAYSNLEPSGNPPALIWDAGEWGKYDIIVDVDNDGFYNATLDPVDEEEEYVAGFVVSETFYAVGGVIELVSNINIPSEKCRSSTPKITTILIISTVFIAIPIVALYRKKLRRWIQSGKD